MTAVDIRFYLMILWRRLPYLLLIVLTVTTLGVLVAYVLPPIYRGSAKLLVEEPQIPVDLARSTVLVDPWHEVEIIQRRLTARENLLAFARRFDVYGEGIGKLADNDIVNDMRSRIIVKPLSSEGAVMFGVSFDARDPETAARIANELVTVIVDKNASLRTDRAIDTLLFFNRGTERLGGELGKIEDQILKFKNANQDSLPDSIDFRRSQQGSQQERLLMLDREEGSLRSRRTNLVQMFESTGRVASAAPATPEQQQLDELNRALAAQLLIFSDASPNITALRARIDRLKDSIRSQQGAEDGKTGKAAKAGPSELDIQLSGIDERLNAIAQEKSSIAQNLAALERTIAATPSNETILSALERHRQNIQMQYNTAVARLAEASTGEQIEASSKGSRLSVVEPAIAPTSPVSPKRFRIAAMGLAAGIALAGALMVLLEILNNKVRRPKDLVQLLQSQPLGTIPHIWTDRELRAHRYRLVIASVATASVISVMIFLMDRFVPINALISKVAGILGHNATI